MVLFGSLEANEQYLYHYTSAEKLAMILFSRSLRLGPYSATRDPRENSTWSLPLHTSGRSEDVDAMEIWEGLDAAIRQRAKLSCFTMDIRVDDFWSMSNRGWGRARMWEQYADRHRGAVMVFDHAKLTASMKQDLGHERLLHGAVRYAPGQWSVELLRSGVDAMDVLENGVERVADELIQRAGTELFFQKDPDWSGETEYRYVVVSDAEAEFVKFSDSLVGIVLGMDFPEHEADVLTYRLTRAGCGDVPISRIWWTNGSPLPVPAMLDSVPPLD